MKNKQAWFFVTILMVALVIATHLCNMLGEVELAFGGIEGSLERS